MKNRQKTRKAAAVCLAAAFAASLIAPAGARTVYSAGESSTDSAEESDLSKLKLSEKLKPDVMESGMRVVVMEGKLITAITVFPRRMDYSLPSFPEVKQNPELPKGCEITSLTMILNYYGYDVDKTVMSDVYLPKAPENLRYGADGRLLGTDLNHYFIGDPKGDGHVCGTGAIVTAANAYLGEQESDRRAIDQNGSTPEKLYQLVCQGIPVIVWVTIDMAERRPTAGWNTEEGAYVEWSTNDHTAVLVGYTENTVKIADPLEGLVEYDKDRFEAAFASRSNQCVILQ
ncbi:MAG: C39 family peptidase [Dorea sp.]|nr:C39 family peptidase [Dorea sp.]